MPAAAQVSGERHQFDDEDLLILQVQLGQLILDQSIIANKIGDSACLYLSDIALVFDFPIEIDEMTERATGWFIREKNTFDFNPDTGNLTIARETRTIDRANFFRTEEGLCVALHVLDQWFPMRSKLDFENALLIVQSLETFPIESRLEREATRKRISRDDSRVRGEAEIVRLPYQWVNWPVLDILAGTTVSPGLGTTESLQSFYDIAIAGDFLKMSTQLYLNGNQNKRIDSARLRFVRQDPEHQLLGPIKYRTLELGDINLISHPIYSGVTSGLGVAISNIPLNQPDEFDRINLTGDLRQGWEIELYRNGSLIDFRTSNSESRYEFLSVPVMYGLNRFELIFYGPQGEVRKEVKTVNASGELLPKGEHRYYIGAIASGSHLLDPLLDSKIGARKSHIRSAGRYEYGVSSLVSLFATLGSIESPDSPMPSEGASRTFGSVGVRTGFGGVAAEAEITTDFSRGSARRVGLYSDVGFGSIFLSHEGFSKLSTEHRPALGGTDLQFSNLARWTGVIGEGIGYRVPVTISAGHDQFEQGVEASSLEMRMAMNIGTAAISNTLRAQSDRIGPDVTRTGEGVFLFSMRGTGGTIRGNLGYQTFPESKPTFAEVTLESSRWDQTRPRLTVSKDFTSEMTTAGLSLTKTFDRFALSGAVTYNSNNEISAGLNFGFSLGRQKTGTWQASHQSSTGRGTLKATAYIDEDLDGVRSVEDTDIPVTQILINRAKKRTTKTANGHFASLPANEVIEIQVAQQVVEDPFVAINDPVRSFVVRPGRTANAEFRFTRTGEIDGMVYMKRSDGTLRAIGGVKLELIDEQGNMTTATSAFDGFYLFESVTFGHYALHVAEDQLKLSSLNAAVQRVDLNKKNDLISGIVITLEPNGAE